MTFALVPATCLVVAVDHDGPLCGIALLGAPGSGKSQTALGLLQTCRFGRSKLISDDMTRLTARNECIWAAPPDGMAGAIELRGTGISFVPISQQHKISFAFRLGLTAERQPDDAAPWAPLGISGPCVPEYRWPSGREGLVLFLRGILSGLSTRAGFDSIPMNAGEEFAQ